MSCELHRQHRPTPLGTVIHHVQPRGMGGPDTPANRIEVCSTGHLNVHRCLDDLLAGRKPTRGTRLERACAKQGYDAWIAAGKPGTPVYELHEETV